MTMTAPRQEQMPLLLPIFPLEGALLLPGGDLPLNIFEPRYVAMVRDALSGDRLVGMIQPCHCPEKIAQAARPFYEIGCAGWISLSEETQDGRFLITLQGVARFHLISHTICDSGYRKAEVDFRDYKDDFYDPPALPPQLTRASMTGKLRDYMAREGLTVDWSLAERIPDHRFYTLLTMICPFTAVEKQALLEAYNFEERCKMMKCLMEIACAEETGKNCMERPC